MAGHTRRAVVKRAVAAGGAAALAACLDAEADPEIPQGPDDLASLPERQHAWNAVLDRDDRGNIVQPRHHLLLLFDTVADGPPTGEARDRFAATLRGLERAYERSNRGLVFTVGYTPSYFDRYAADLASSVDLPAPEPLAPFEDPALDRPDVIVHLASDHGKVVLAAEGSLLGNRDRVNDTALEASVDGILERTDRRTGFVGDGLPAERQDVRGIPDSEPVPEDAPLFMGFKSGFSGNQATEDRVTIQSGPFAGGTTQHVSRIRLNLGQWYTQDTRSQREAKMFCPVHAAEGRIEGAGDNLGDDSGIEDCRETLDRDARSAGMVGHAQKAAQVREDGDPVILRRDFDSTDGGEAGVHFLALQRRIAEFVATREAMNGRELAEESAVGPRTNNGILQYISVKRRGNYLLPPRRHRVFPRPQPG